MQAPANAQNFNRYSYCLNNPLMYTDLSGELFWLIPGLIRGTINLAINWKNIDNFLEGFAVFGSGFVNGSLSTINPLWGAAIGEGIQRGVNSIVAQTGNGIGLNQINWGKVGKETLYGVGGGLAVGLVAQNFSYDFKLKGRSVFSNSSANLTGATHRLASIQNHIVRSSAYRIGGNIMTGNSPFKGIGTRDFWGLNASIILPALTDGVRYVGEKQGWFNNFLTRNTSDQVDQVYRDSPFYDSSIRDLNSYDILGTGFSSLNITPNGHLHLLGDVIVNLITKIPEGKSGTELFTVDWSSNFNVRGFYTLFFK